MSETTTLYLNERVASFGPGITPIAHLRSDYIQFCAFNNLIPDSWNVLGKAMKANQFKTGQRMVGGKSTRVWLGFELKRYRSRVAHEKLEAYLAARMEEDENGFETTEEGMRIARNGTPDELYNFALESATEFLRVTPSTTPFTVDDVRLAICENAPNCPNHDLYFFQSPTTGRYWFKIKTSWLGCLMKDMKDAGFMHRLNEDDDEDTIDGVRSRRPPSHGGIKPLWISDKFNGTAKPTASLVGVFEEE